MELVKLLPSLCNDVLLNDPMATYKICVDMEILCKKSNGIGLAAAQVGIPLKLYVLDLGTFQYFANCSYSFLDTSKELQSIEGCLSIPGRRFLVTRKLPVKITGYLLNKQCVFEKFEVVYSDRMGICHQHEIDHGLDILIDKIGKEVVF